MANKKAPKAKHVEDLAAEIIGSLDAEFHSASDRSFAVLAASYMDAIPEQTLRAAFIDDPDATELLLSVNGPIGSNGARYNLAYSLGLIDKHERDDLKTIAHIRNRFAHNYVTHTFDADDQVRDWVRGMNFARRRSVLQAELAAKAPSPADAAAIANLRQSARDIFRDSIIEFLVLLLPRLRDVRRAHQALWY